VTLQEIPTVTILATFEKLASRFQKRRTSSLETVEAAAQALAGGGTIDDAAVESALVSAGLTLDDFKIRTEFHVERRKKLDELDKLGAARKRAEDLDQRIEAENKKHAEIVEAYRARWLALRQQADEAAQQVAQSRDARDWLLHPDRAPLALRDDYVAALDVEQKARERIGDVERLIRQLREKHDSEKGWIEQILAEDLRTIHPPAAAVAKSQRDKLGAAQAEKLDLHERRRDRFAREIKEAEADLEVARGELMKAEAVLADLRKRILKS